MSPLSAELQSIPWTRNFNSASLPQFDGETDPSKFLLKYEAAAKASGGSNAIKAKALVMALKGPSQAWYSHIPKRYIQSWSKLRGHLLTTFHSNQPDEMTPIELMHACTQGEKEALQDFTGRIVCIAAQEPRESESNIINFAVASLHVGSCQDFLERNKPRILVELIGVFHEYAKSDWGRRRRLEMVNA